jgi:hypothetical protein
VIKVELRKGQTGLRQCYNWQNFGHVWADCKQPHGVSGVVVATCIGNALIRQIQNLCQAAGMHPSRWRQTSSSIILRMQPCERTVEEKSTRS